MVDVKVAIKVTAMVAGFAIIFVSGFALFDAAKIVFPHVAEGGGELKIINVSSDPDANSFEIEMRAFSPASTRKYAFVVKENDRWTYNFTPPVDNGNWHELKKRAKNRLQGPLSPYDQPPSWAYVEVEKNTKSTEIVFDHDLDDIPCKVKVELGKKCGQVKKYTPRIAGGCGWLKGGTFGEDKKKVDEFVIDFQDDEFLDEHPDLTAPDQC